MSEKIKETKISLKMLKEWKACPEATQWFKKQKDKTLTGLVQKLISEEQYSWLDFGISRWIRENPAAKELCEEIWRISLRVSPSEESREDFSKRTILVIYRELQNKGFIPQI